MTRLVLAARELRRPVLETLGEAHARQDLGSLRPGELRIEASHQQRHGDVLERRELGQ
jgi:hypothetical protein